MMRRTVLLVPSSFLSLCSRSLLRKRGGLPALAASPGLTQGIGKAEDLQKKLYEAQYKEARAEDFDSPRTEEDGAREILKEYRKMRAQNQEIARRISATPEWKQYDNELSFEINCLEESWNHRVFKEDMPVNKENVKTLEEARETICHFYMQKHAPVLAPLSHRINREVLDEIASGKLVIGEPDDSFIQEIYEKRQKQEEDPQVFETVVRDELKLAGEEEQSDAEFLIESNWSQEELDKQKKMAFVRTRKRSEFPEEDE